MILTKKLLEQNNACPEGINFCERNKLFGFDLDRMSEVMGDYKDFVRWINVAIRDWDIEHDANGNMISKLCKDINQLINFTYNDAGQKLSVVNNGVIIEENVYNEQGQLRSSTYKDSGYFLYSYDEHGKLIAKEMYNGVKTHHIIYKYDEHDNLVVTNDNGDETIFEYDEKSNITKMTVSHLYSSREPSWIKYEHDDRGNIIKTTDLIGHVNEWEYDVHTNIIWDLDCYGTLTNHNIEYYDNGQLKRYDNLHIPLI
jgi:uncharacterized protein RhaS with RHS repeats